ncbi:MAG: S1 RNA-binding domain-containing protein [Ruminococcus sp.]|nr:S1 RNA-binding domain-containing protein [Ruminococcus sp.]MBQ7071472.1 S1 RNA-binding domain-containing protein [Ruminococcus sp.]
MKRYLPEGKIFNDPENQYYISSAEAMAEAMTHGITVEARAKMCDNAHDLYVDLECGTGVIPREEGAIGIKDGTTKDIALLSRVNKTVCFKVTDIKDTPDGPLFILSRRKAQEECMEKFVAFLENGDIIPAKVTHLETFGAFVDIGCGIVSLIPIDAISVSRISHPCDRFFNGQDIFAVVKGRENGRITLTHKELLGTWLENAGQFAPGETVSGVVRSVEPYGVFIELAPNLAGLAEPREGVYPGQAASVYIKAIIPEKMKVKLIIVDVFDSSGFPGKINYFIKDGKLDKWVYSTDSCDKEIVSEFI